MSNLSRYKKPPAVKLPLPPKKNAMKQCMLNVSASDDDDFIAPKPNRKKLPITNKNDQEEVEQKDNEKDFIILHDVQQQEIEPPKPLPKVKNVPIENKPLQPPRPIITKMRRRKVNLNELPLYSATDKDKKLDIERRMDMILDGHVDKCEVERGEYYIRENPPITSIRCPDRLKDCLNDTSTCLWSLSSSEISTREVPEIYVSQSVSECKLNEDIARKSIIIHPTSPITEDVRVNKDEKDVTKNSRIIKSLPKIETKNVTMKVSSQHPQKIDDPSSTQAQPQLIKDLLKMFVSMEAADVTVYGREEKPIRCHKFMLMARSRKLFSEIVQETNRKGIVRDIIALTSFSHLAVKAFIKFLYCGKLKELNGQDLKDALELGSIYGIVISQQKSDNATSTNHNSLSQAASSKTSIETYEQPVELPCSTSSPISTPNMEQNDTSFQAMDYSTTETPILELKGQDLEDVLEPELPCFASSPISSQNMDMEQDNTLFQALVYSTNNTPIKLKRQELEDDLELGSTYGIVINQQQSVNKASTNHKLPSAETSSKTSVESCELVDLPCFTSSPISTPNVAQKKNLYPYQAMDYSTIDTPILKKELKRYGLKPLPRSKAKLILRHIDKETSQ